MTKLVNILLVSLLAAGSLWASYAVVSLAGLEHVIPGLRFLFAPATALSAAAITMASKLYELAELKGVTHWQIQALRKPFKVIEARLWLVIGVVLLTSLIGMLLGFFAESKMGAWLHHAVAFTLAACFASTSFTLIYLRMLQRDISEFRFRVAEQLKQNERRDELLKLLASPKA